MSYKTAYLLLEVSLTAWFVGAGIFVAHGNKTVSATGFLLALAISIIVWIWPKRA